MSKDRTQGRRRKGLRLKVWRLFKTGPGGEVACFYCQTPLGFSKMTVEHVVPLSMGGTDHIDNLVPACTCCNHEQGRVTERKRHENQT